MEVFDIKETYFFSSVLTSAFSSTFSSVLAAVLYLSFNALMISFVMSYLSSAYKTDAASPVP
jgi:hypothetical protein